MTEESVEELIETHNRRVRRMMRAVIVAYVAAFVLSASAVFVSIYSSQSAIAESERKSAVALVESQRKWCALLVPLDLNYQTNTPPTESGRRFAAIVHGLRADFGCQ
ncbi:MAG TPA: hypothetical protein VGP26_14595 [Actinophytocola sp.]|jgi:hypothetical protein|nr:hypothetical protein [Actinophytocola sp.]